MQYFIDYVAELINESRKKCNTGKAPAEVLSSRLPYPKSQARAHEC